MRQLRFLLEESGGGIEEALLPRIRRMKSLRCLDVFAAFFQGFVIREIPKLVKPGHRFAPMGHGALWFLGGHVGKGLLGFHILERVQEGDALFDKGLDVRGATGGEIHFAKLVRRRGGCGIRANCRSLKSNKNEEQPENRVEPAWMAHDVSSDRWQRFYLRRLSEAELNLLDAGCNGGWTRLWRCGYNEGGAVLRSR